MGIFSFLNSSSHATLALPEKIWEENGYCTAYVIDKFRLPNAAHTFYQLHGWLELHLIQAENYHPAESHWIANWGNRYPDPEIGDRIRFRVKKAEWHPNGFNHDSRRIPHVRNITVYDLTILRDGDPV